MEFPTGGGTVCLVVGCGNGIAEGSFARTADIVAAQITRTVDADVATQYVFHVIQRAVHLAAGRGIGTSGRNCARSYIRNGFTARIDAGFGYARATSNGQTVGVQFAVACRDTGYVQVVSQREADLVVGNLGFDVGIADVFDGFTQCNGVDCAAVGINLQAFAFQCAYGIVHRCGHAACGGGFVCIRRRRCGNLARRGIRIQCDGCAYAVQTVVQHGQNVTDIVFGNGSSGAVGHGIGWRTDAAIGLYHRSAAQVSGCGIGSLVQLAAVDGLGAGGVNCACCNTNDCVAAIIQTVIGQFDWVA